MSTAERPGRHAGQVVIVTGAAQGLGLACAERFLAEGARVLLTDRTADAVRAHAERLGANASWIAADLAEVDADMAAAVVARAIEAFGAVTVLISNAGMAPTAAFVDFAEDVFDTVQRVNLKAPFLLGQAAARAMIAAGRKGAIINMSSINAVLAIPDSVAYAVSKGGMRQLTAVMALSLIQHGIRVNAIGPGTIGTEMARAAVMGDEGKRQAILSRTPIGRIGEPSEIAAIASFLASDDASYIVGQTIYADGGRLVLNTTVPVAEG